MGFRWAMDRTMQHDETTPGQVAGVGSGEGVSQRARPPTRVGWWWSSSSCTGNT